MEGAAAIVRYAASEMSLETAEAAVFANPDDEPAWQVYADALQAAGDPRGELMALQVRRHTAPATVERESTLLQQNAERWLFPGAGVHLGRGLHVDWRNGFPWSVTIRSVADRRVPAIDGAAMWRRLAEVPANVRFVRRVVFGSPSSLENGDWANCIVALRDHPPPWLQYLTCERGNFWDISMTRISGLDAEFWKAVPRLEELYLELGEIHLSSIDAPALKRVRFVSSSLDERVMDELTRARWPALEALSVYLGSPEYGGLDSAESVQALLQTAAPPRLKHLGLCNATFADELPQLLASSSWLPQLSSLDLSDGTLGDEGASFILANAPKFAHLEQLNLSHGFFSDACIERLRAQFQGVILNNLNPADADFRFVAVVE